jgi:5-methyltetrahydropteroyltriglutamate--homocysteine methyltransferase
MKYTIFLWNFIQLKDIFYIGLDLIHGTKTLNLVKTVGFPKDKYLFTGVIDGRNIWANDLTTSFNILKDPERLLVKVCVFTLFYSAS